MPIFDSILAVVTPPTPVSKPVHTLVENRIARVSPQESVPVPVQRSRRPHNENLSTPSISGMMNGNTLSAVAEPDNNTGLSHEPARDQSIDPSALALAWRAFADQVDAPQLKSALSVREPLLLENYSIEYHLDNEVQRQRIIQDLKPKLLSYLTNELNNEHLSIEFVVSENLEEIMNKPYTDQEKFNVMVHKYPVLGLLKQRFGLDFE